MKRSLLCCLLALCLLALCVPRTFAAETVPKSEPKPPSRKELEETYRKTELPYTDLDSDELRCVVAWAELNDIFPNRSTLIPKGTTLLLPILNVQSTRTEFYVMLWKACGKEEVKPYPLQNPDIDPQSEEGKALSWAYRKGLLSPKGKYENRNYVERLEIALCLYKLAGSPYNKNLKNLPKDVKSLKPNEQQAVMWAIDKKIIGLSSDNLFHPTGQKGYCTRKDCATFLYRFYLLRVDEQTSPG